MVEKKIKGRKRHIVVDTQGHLLHVSVHAANIHDTKAGGPVFKSAVEKYPTIRGVSADSGYRKTMENFVKNSLFKNINIATKDAHQWTVLAKRWIVERTFAWFNGYRRLAKDFEVSVSSAVNFVIIAHSMLLLQRF